MHYITVNKPIYLYALNPENKQYNLFTKYAPTLLFDVKTWELPSYNTEMFRMDLILGKYSQKCCRI
jgi:hypothetical protein